MSRFSQVSTVFDGRELVALSDVFRLCTKIRIYRFVRARCSGHVLSRSLDRAPSQRSSPRTLASPSVLIFRLSGSSLSLERNLRDPLRKACRIVVVRDRQHRWPPVRESSREMASRGLASSKQIVRKAGSRLNFQRKVYDYSSVGAHSYRIERITTGGRS